MPVTQIIKIMTDAGLLRCVALVRSDLTSNQLLVTANIVPSSPILVTLMMEAIHSSETSVPRELHRVTSKKTAFFIVIAVKISNLT
jgi:hypothetical protein